MVNFQLTHLLESNQSACFGFNVAASGTPAQIFALPSTVVPVLALEFQCSPAKHGVKENIAAFKRSTSEFVCADMTPVLMLADGWKGAPATHDSAVLAHQNVVFIVAARTSTERW